MKRFLRILSITLVVLTFAFILGSCSKIENKPLKVIEYLDDKGYDSYLMVDSEDKDYFSRKTGIKEKNIGWIIEIDEEYDPDDYYNSSNEEGLLIFCKTSAAAMKAKKALIKYADENKEKEFVVERKGRFVYCGSEEIWNVLN